MALDSGAITAADSAVITGDISKTLVKSPHRCGLLMRSANLEYLKGLELIKHKQESDL